MVRGFNALGIDVTQTVDWMVIKDDGIHINSLMHSLHAIRAQAIKLGLNRHDNDYPVWCKGQMV